MKTICCRRDLGYTRVAGFTLFDSASLEFQETTPREVEKLVHQGQINGLRFSENGELIPDLEGWNLGNYKICSGIGKFRDWNTQDPRGATCYSVVRAININNVGCIYETINNRCGRVFYTGKQLAALSSIFWVGGIKVNEDDDTIELCPGVELVDLSDGDVYELGNQVLNKEQLQKQIQAQNMAELFGEAPTGVEGLAETPNVESSEEQQSTENAEAAEPPQEETITNLEGDTNPEEPDTTELNDTTEHQAEATNDATEARDQEVQAQEAQEAQEVSGDEAIQVSGEAQPEEVQPEEQPGEEQPQEEVEGHEQQKEDDAAKGTEFRQHDRKSGHKNNRRKH